MRKYIHILALFLLLAFCMPLSGLALENWINSYIVRAREVETPVFPYAGQRFLAECDSLWGVVKSHLNPVDDAFFRAQKNPIVLKEGTYVVMVEYDAATNTIPSATISALGFATHKGMMNMIASTWVRRDQKVYYAVDEELEPVSVLPSLVPIEVSELMAQFNSSLLEAAEMEAANEASREAQAALTAIRKVYDVKLQTTGNLSGFTIGTAVLLAGLDDSTLRNWQFSIVSDGLSNIPRIYLATNIQDDSMYSGKRVWYDVTQARFHGLGIDDVPWVD